ncbi:hypothetical protein [Massilia sp. YIM B02443]|uniref:hypothetical protein n=1 Tax=Massilia sp. YIM B02443 TaxID=3050127 RepID=UPI0025B67AD0|nr:hypothetical protein [Massilia sp. YIM B02443]MDN4039907.1 hypothetical protein [Massilia sp. YIM B02443]
MFAKKIFEDVPGFGGSFYRETQYEEILDRCARVRGLLAERGLRFHRDSGLGKVMRNAETLIKTRLSGERNADVSDILNLLYASRIAESILNAQNDPGAWECIRRIAGNQLGSLDRLQSMGKDALWELELANRLKRLGATVLHTEPDLTVEFSDTAYGISCKKIYSEKGVEAQVRKGVQQLKKTNVRGLVAVSLDELAPRDSILGGPSQDGAAQFLSDFNKAFVERHIRKVIRYVIDGRCDGLLISTSVFSDIKLAENRWSSHTQSMLWSVKDVSPDMTSRLALFGQLLNVDKA